MMQMVHISLHLDLSVLRRRRRGTRTSWIDAVMTDVNTFLVGVEHNVDILTSAVGHAEVAVVC